MQPRFYRPVVVLSAILWFMLGMHMPMLHDMNHAKEHPGILVAMAALAIGGVVSLFNLLRSSPAQS